MRMKSKHLRLAAILQWFTRWQNCYRIALLRQLGVEIGADSIIESDVDIDFGFVPTKPGVLRIGDRTHLSRGVVLYCYGGSIVLNENVFLGHYTVIYGNGGVTIGKDTLIATHCRILSSNHTIPDTNSRIRSKPDILLPTTIGEDVWLGAAVTILGGVSIGNGCVVGAGAVVTKDLPPYSVAVGIPARVIRIRE